MRNLFVLFLILFCFQSLKNPTITHQPPPRHNDTLILIEAVEDYIDQFRSPLSADKLVYSCIKHDISPVWVLAQGTLESHLGTKGQARKTYSVWGVGAWDTSSHKTKKRTGYRSFDDSIEPYMALLRKYMAHKTTKQLLNSFTYKGKRYAQDPSYEQKLKAKIEYINRTTRIDELWNIVNQ